MSERLTPEQALASLRKAVDEGRPIEYAANTRGALLYEIPAVLFDIDPVFVSDGSHLLDFAPIDDAVRQRARDAWGIELSDDSALLYLWCVADAIIGRKAT